MTYEGWTRLSEPGDKCGTVWRHRSGWGVRHCGHPTANWPYYLISPSGDHVFDRTGRGFRLLVDAKQAAETRALQDRVAQIGVVVVGNAKSTECA